MSISGLHPKSPKAFVIDQLDAETGKFDEPKVFLGFTSRISVINCKINWLGD
jgi:Inorganic Pyrophosphatase